MRETREAGAERGEAMREVNNPVTRACKLLLQYGDVDRIIVAQELNDYVRRLNLALMVATGALHDIAEMPEYDQDDAHRLRAKARAALSTGEGGEHG